MEGRLYLLMLRQHLLKGRQRTKLRGPRGARQHLVMVLQCERLMGRRLHLLTLLQLMKSGDTVRGDTRDSAFTARDSAFIGVSYTTLPRLYVSSA